MSGLLGESCLFTSDQLTGPAKAHPRPCPPLARHSPRTAYTNQVHRWTPVLATTILDHLPVTGKPRRHLTLRNPNTEMVRVRRSASENECPICMDPARFALETNCGHVYCATCIIQNWQTNFTITPMLCPYCRQEIILLLPCFSEGEVMAADVPAVMERERVVAQVQEYNRMYSQHPRSWYGQLQDLPTILRHIWAELFTWRGILMAFKLRVILSVVMAVLYVVSPIDIIPEAFLGLLGLADDVVVIIIILIQVSIVYRTVVANRDW
ncbi:E3 ubiquitin-protein ligase RNF170-like [Portunus trituberculatus]|uniref:E3 ubiquitin-protein ligase RNF170-like n=1 Tax=Portunus trituberculatus TaxID=210409 RepID=UPI001E1CF94C|nr:E3 ubiquitin-protein ligase RNF170-like [Portunus trituberculatus]